MELFTFWGRKVMLTKTGQSLWALTKTGQSLWGLTSSINCFRQYSSKIVGLRHQRPARHVRIKVPNTLAHFLHVPWVKVPTILAYIFHVPWLKVPTTLVCFLCVPWLKVPTILEQLIAVVCHLLLSQSDYMLYHTFIKSNLDYAFAESYELLDVLLLSYLQVQVSLIQVFTSLYYFFPSVTLLMFSSVLFSGASGCSFYTVVFHHLFYFILGWPFWVDGLYLGLTILGWWPLLENPRPTTTIRLQQ